MDDVIFAKKWATLLVQRVTSRVVVCRLTPLLRRIGRRVLHETAGA